MKRLSTFSCFVLLFTLAAYPAAGSDQPSFPAPAREYRSVVQRRIDDVWSRIERKLDKFRVSVDRKNQIRRMFDDAAKEVWVKYEDAAADDSISRDEDQRLRAAIRQIRGQVRAKLAEERNRGKENAR